MTVVVKIGTSSLTEKDGSFCNEKLKDIVRQVADLKDAGNSVVIVTSGSIATGFRRLGYNQRPRSVAAKQAAAAVGQGILIEEYTKYLYKRGYVGAQILLTRGDFADKRRYDNAFSAITELLKNGAVPIINENDTISIEELRFGDNDMLSAEVAAMIHADLLVIMTDIDGLYTNDPRKDENAKHIDYIDAVTQSVEALGGGAASELSTGGMRSKITAAALATIAGVPVFICSFKDENSIVKSIDQSTRGTYFKAEKYNLKTRLQWMAFYSKCKGRLYIDAGAAKALTEGKKSLLPSGIVSVEGKFKAGDVVDVYSSENLFLGRGICNYEKSMLEEIKNESDKTKKQSVAIHRDNWVESEKIQLIRDEETVQKLREKNEKKVNDK